MIKHKMSILASGHKVTYLDGEELEKQVDNFPPYKDGMVRLSPGDWIFPVGFLKYAKDIYNFRLHKDDVFVMTWPKCGTTWMQEIVWTMRNNPDLNGEDAKTNIFLRSPFLEFDFLLGLKESVSDDPIAKVLMNMCPDANMSRGVFIQLTEVLPCPRTIKTHLPLSLLGKDLLNTAKVVCVIRDPKDCCVSYCHHSKLIKVHGFLGSISNFVDFFLKGDLVYGPYDAFLKDIWNMKDHKNLLIVSYENLKKNGIAEFKRLNEFLETDLTEGQLEKIAEYTSFESMKSRSHVVESSHFYNEDILKNEGGFFWKGQVGNYKTNLTPALEEALDEWKEEKLVKNGIKFDCPWL